jgi:hypothetical protein
MTLFSDRPYVLNIGLRASGKSTFRKQLLPPDQIQPSTPEDATWLVYSIRNAYVRAICDPVMSYFEDGKSDGDKVGRRVYKRCKRILDMTQELTDSFRQRGGLAPEKLEELEKLCEKVKKTLQTMCNEPPQSILRDIKESNSHYVVYWPPAQGEEILEQLDRLPAVFSIEYEPQLHDIQTAYAPSYNFHENRIKIDDYDVSVLDFGSRGGESMKQMVVEGDVTLCFFRMDYLAWPEIDEDVKLNWQRNDNILSPFYRFSAPFPLILNVSLHASFNSTKDTCAVLT